MSACFQISLGTIIARHSSVRNGERTFGTPTTISVAVITIVVVVV